MARWPAIGALRLGGGEADGMANPSLLADWPLPCLRDWPALVAAPHSEVELAAIRRSVLRGKPYGYRTWVEKTARELGLESALRPPHRPRK